jgi:hypothetical protein
MRVKLIHFKLVFFFKKKKFNTLKKKREQYNSLVNSAIFLHCSYEQMTWNHNDVAWCLSIELSPWNTIILIYSMFVNDVCIDPNL